MIWQGLRSVCSLVDSNLVSVFQALRSDLTSLHHMLSYGYLKWALNYHRLIGWFRKDSGHTMGSIRWARRGIHEGVSITSVDPCFKNRYLNGLNVLTVKKLQGINVVLDRSFRTLGGHWTSVDSERGPFGSERGTKGKRRREFGCRKNNHASSLQQPPRVLFIHIRRFYIGPNCPCTYSDTKHILNN